MNEQQLREKGFVYVNGQWFKQSEAVKGMTEAQEQTLVRDVPAALAVREERVGISSDEAKLNKLERDFLAYLRAHHHPWIGIQCFSVKLADDCRFTPDFWTLPPSMSSIKLHAWETKGFFRDDAKVKLKVAARMYPMIKFTLVQRVKGSWKFSEVRP